MAEIRKWVKTRKEKAAYKVLLEHAKLVRDAVLDFDNLLKAYRKGKESDIEVIIKRISQMEHEADALRRKILDELTVGDLPSAERDDLMTLTRAADNMADAAHLAGIRLNMFEFPIAQKIADFLTEMYSGSRDCAQRTYELLFDMVKGKSENILERCDEIDRLEHVVDIAHMKTISQIRNSAKKNELDTIDAVIALNVIEFIEDIADYSEDVADALRLLWLRANEYSIMK